MSFARKTGFWMEEMAHKHSRKIHFKRIYHEVYELLVTKIAKWLSNVHCESWAMRISTVSRYPDQPHLKTLSGHPVAWELHIISEPLPLSLPDLQTECPDVSPVFLMFWLDFGFVLSLQTCLLVAGLCLTPVIVTGPALLRYCGTVPLVHEASSSACSDATFVFPHTGSSLTVSARLISSGICPQSISTLHSTENMQKLNVVEVMNN